MGNTSNSLDLKSLSIIPGKQCWILYVDIMVLDSGGNLFDAISIATRAALHNTRIPKLSVVAGDQGELEIEVSDDLSEAVRLNIDNVPICVTLTKIGTQYVVDSTLEEELCMQVRLTVGINKDGNICGILKGGKGGIDPSSLYEMIQSSRKIGQTLLNKLNDALRKEETISREPLGFFGS